MNFFTKNRDLSELKQITSRVWKLEPSIPNTLKELVNMSDTLRARAIKGESLNSLLPEAYAVVREVASHTVRMRPYDEQIMGAIALHQGKVIEMANGEGKTLTATMPAYLNSLSGQRVHIATYNDYLARRDAQWMGPIYATLGLSVGVIQSGESYHLNKQDDKYALMPCSRKDAYACHITYGAHQEFGFDYLRSNMARDENSIAQNSLDYVILDEADSVLIDRARSPLQITRNLERHPGWYRTLSTVAQHLQMDADFVLHPQIELTQEGICKAEILMGIKNLYSQSQAGTAHQLIQSIRALHFYKANRDYLAKDGQVVLIDEYTGRLLLGSRLPNGLHQAIEAKEGLEITPDTRKLAEISYQHFFKLYWKVAGMTATAQTVEDELQEQYQLGVVIIPTC